MYVATATAALVTIARLRQKLGATKKLEEEEESASNVAQLDRIRIYSI